MLKKFENECLVSRARFLRHPHILTAVLHFIAVLPEALTIQFKHPVCTSVASSSPRAHRSFGRLDPSSRLPAHECNQHNQRCCDDKHDANVFRLHHGLRVRMTVKKGTRKCVGVVTMRARARARTRVRECLICVSNALAPRRLSLSSNPCMGQPDIASRVGESTMTSLFGCCFSSNVTRRHFCAKVEVGFKDFTSASCGLVPISPNVYI